MPAGSSFLDAAADLLLGGRCAGCARPGRLLCPGCDAMLAGCLATAGPVWPDPAPAGLVPPFAAAAYDGPVRGLLLGHKERRLLALRWPLSRLLALAVAAALADNTAAHPLPTGRAAGPIVLVPVPSRRGSARARGHDPTGRLTTGAARLLDRAGVDAVAVPLLRSRPGVLDQAGLDAAARAANLAGSMHCPTELLRRLAARRTAATVVVCDDVLTTGATAREAQRALQAVGLDVRAIAAVAATRRRTPGRDLRPFDLQG